MVDVRFELTTNDPWSVDHAICEGISPLGYWQQVNQSPTQTEPYNSALCGVHTSVALSSAAKNSGNLYPVYHLFAPSELVQQ